MNIVSTKGTLFLTKDNEHCYEELTEYDNGCYRIYIEVDNKNIKYIDHCEYQGLVVGIKGDSELAKVLRKLKYD